MKEHQTKPEGFESPSTAQSDVDCKLEGDCYSESEIRKKVKTSSDFSEQSDYEYEPFLPDQAQIRDLPLKYQEILLNKGAVRQLQQIAIQSAMLGTNAEDSFAKIWHNFEVFFESGEQGQASDDFSLSEESCEKDPHNNVNANQAYEYHADFISWYQVPAKKYSFEDVFLKDELEGVFMKDEGEDGYFSNRNKTSGAIKIKNYFDEINPFCKVEETL